MIRKKSIYVKYKLKRIIRYKIEKRCQKSNYYTKFFLIFEMILWFFINNYFSINHFKKLLKLPKCRSKNYFFIANYRHIFLQILTKLNRVDEFQFRF